MSVGLLDANVLAAGFANADGPPGQLVDLWRAGRFVLIVSEHVLSELEGTFAKPYFRRRMSSDQQARALSLLRADAVMVTISASIRGVASHPSDDLVLATAVSGRADYLVTGDIELRRLSPFRGIVILSPRAFLDVLTGQQSG